MYLDTSRVPCPLELVQLLRKTSFLVDVTWGGGPPGLWEPLCLGRGASGTLCVWGGGPLRLWEPLCLGRGASGTLCVWGGGPLGLSVSGEGSLWDPLCLGRGASGALRPSVSAGGSLFRGADTGTRNGPSALGFKASTEQPGALWVEPGAGTAPGPWARKANVPAHEHPASLRLSGHSRSRTCQLFALTRVCGCYHACLKIRIRLGGLLVAPVRSGS